MAKQIKSSTGQPARKNNNKRPQKKPKAASEAEAQARALRKFLFPHATD